MVRLCFIQSNCIRRRCDLIEEVSRNNTRNNCRRWQKWIPPRKKNSADKRVSKSPRLKLAHYNFRVEYDSQLLPNIGRMHVGTSFRVIFLTNFMTTWKLNNSLVNDVKNTHRTKSPEQWELKLYNLKVKTTRCGRK